MSDIHVRSIEVKSYLEETKYFLILSGHVDALLGLNLPFTPKLDATVRGINKAYMPLHVYDEMGSNVRRFGNNYIRITHVMKRSHSEEVDVFSREELCDVMLNEGWNLMGFACYPEQVVVEKWVKRIKTEI